MAAVDPNQLGTGKQILGVIWLGLFPTMNPLCRLQGPHMVLEVWAHIKIMIPVAIKK